MILMYNYFTGENQASNGIRCIRDKRKLVLDALCGAKRFPNFNREGNSRINASGEEVLVKILSERGNPVEAHKLASEVLTCL